MANTAAAPPSAIERERAKLYAFLVGPGRPRVSSESRGDKAAPRLIAPGSNIQRCPSEPDSKMARMGKAKPSVSMTRPAALLFVEPHPCVHPA